MAIVKLPTWYYRQQNADYTREVPAEGFGGWDRAELEMDTASTALVVMHAWNCGTYEEFPGWWRAIEYIPRSHAIAKNIIPIAAGAARKAGMHVINIVGGQGYYETLPAYLETVKITERVLPVRAPLPPWVSADATTKKLLDFKRDHGFPGAHNIADIEAGAKQMGFAPGAEPAAGDSIAKDTDQVLALCLERGIKHLVYTGFAINWCLLLSPGGMHDMRGRGLVCSAIRQAVTAVESRETARGELGKENGLWRVAVSYGFVYDLEPFVQAMASVPKAP